MKIKEYQEAALKTAIYNKTGYMGIVYPMLGLIGELGEFEEVYAQYCNSHKPLVTPVMKELGDVIWYMNAVSDALGTSLVEVDTQFTLITNINFIEPINIMSQLAELTKKGWRDEEGNIGEIRKGKMLTQLTILWSYVSSISTKLGVTLGEVLQMNIDKLNKRKNEGKLRGDGDNR